MIAATRTPTTRTTGKATAVAMRAGEYWRALADESRVLPSVFAVAASAPSTGFPTVSFAESRSDDSAAMLTDPSCRAEWVVGAAGGAAAR